MDCYRPWLDARIVHNPNTSRDRRERLDWRLHAVDSHGFTELPERYTWKPTTDCIAILSSGMGIEHISGWGSRIWIEDTCERILISIEDAHFEDRMSSYLKERIDHDLNP